MSAFADWYEQPATLSVIGAYYKTREPAQTIARAAWLAALEEAKRQMPETAPAGRGAQTIGYAMALTECSARISALIEASKEPA